MTPRINTADYIRPATAATLAGVSRALAYRMVKDGTVPSVEIDGVVLVHRRDVRRIVATPGMGRPRKARDA
jgi:predicted site-specific integrase-resolvase